MNGFDLHTHSVRSDGTEPPARVAALAAAAGLAGVALTDHDTLDGWDEAAAACAERGVEFVPGLELSTELGQRSVHVLGYWVDPTYDELRAECDRLRNERLRRAREILGKLDRLGLALELSTVTDKAGGAPIGRPHIAAAMVDAGHVEDVDAAFDRYLADGGPAYVAKHALSPERGVELIVAAGGVAVLAHPGLGRREAQVDLALLDRMVGAGLTGVEADHVGHDEATRVFWRVAADQRDLVVTGASDFHGVRKDSHLGDATTAPAAVDALRERARPRSTDLLKEGATW